MSQFHSNWLRVVLRVVWIAYALTLFTATHIPVPDMLEEVVGAYDKIIHASAFFVLGMLTFLSLSWGEKFRAPSIWLLLGMIVYAAIDELLQGLTNRTPDVQDWFSDSSGILAAFLLIRFAEQWFLAPPSGRKFLRNLKSSEPDAA